MLGILKLLFDNPDREAKRLNRDAATVIDSATRSISVDRVREIALVTLEHLGKARAHLDTHSQSHDQVLYRFQQLHGEARRRMDQVGLTAYTLIIIHLQAEALGDIAAPAVAAIDEFLGQWAHVAEERQRASTR